MKSNKTMVGAVLAGIGASACCTLPLIASLLGVGFLSTAGQFIETYRPMFLTLAFGLLGFSAYLIFLRPWLEQRKADKAGVACECKKPAKSTRITLVFVAAFTIGLSFFPEYSVSLFASDNKKTTNAKPLLVGTVGISGMTCEGCAISVKKTFKKSKIVQGVKVSYKQGQAIVEFNIKDQSKSENLIKEKLKELGYEITNIKWSKP